LSRSWNALVMIVGCRGFRKATPAWFPRDSRSQKDGQRPIAVAPPPADARLQAPPLATMRGRLCHAPRSGP
jgi:hypothetical protein